MICITYLKYAYKSFKQFIEKLYTSTRAASMKRASIMHLSSVKVRKNVCEFGY